MKIVGKRFIKSNLLRNQKFTDNNSEEKDLRITLAQAVNGQVNKSIRGMPWHWEPKKDVISCEKLR